MAHESIDFTVRVAWRFISEKEAADMHGPEADVVRRFHEVVEEFTEESDEYPAVFDVGVEATAEYSDGEDGSVWVDYTHRVSLKVDEGSTRADVPEAAELAEVVRERRSHADVVEVVDGYHPDIGDTAKLAKKE